MDSKVIIIIILSLIIIVGIIVTVYKFIKNKKEDSFSSLLFTSGLGLVTAASSNNIDKALVALGVAKNYENASKLGGDFNIYYFCLGTFLIVISIVMFWGARNKLCILNINAYSHKKIESYLKHIKVSNYDFREREIDFVNIYNEIFSKRHDDESFECIKKELQEKVEAFKNETTDIKRGYTGIAPIPFIMYAGTYLERVIINKYYEFDKVKTQNYYVLSGKEDKSSSELKLKTNLDTLDMSKVEVVISISLTQPIVSAQLTQFVAANIVEFSVDNCGDNIIRSVPQLESYTNLIFATIEEIGRRIPNLEKIHLVYSGQSCLALEMGKRCVDSTRIPQIISYQFETQGSVKYPWGIIINGQEKGKLIKV